MGFSYYEQVITDFETRRQEQLSAERERNFQQEVEQLRTATERFNQQEPVAPKRRWWEKLKFTLSRVK